MTDPDRKTILVAQPDLQLMREAVEAALPEEACGLLIGTFSGNQACVLRAIPVTNILHSPVQFRMSGEEQVAAFVWMEQEQLDLVGVYHSHPHGPPGPSQKDIDEAYYEDVVHLIWSNSAGSWHCRAFTIDAGRVFPAVLQVQA